MRLRLLVPISFIVTAILHSPADAQVRGGPTGGTQCLIGGKFVFVPSGGCPANGGGGGGGGYAQPPYDPEAEAAAAAAAAAAEQQRQEELKRQEEEVQRRGIRSGQAAASGL